MINNRFSVRASYVFVVLILSGLAVYSGELFWRSFLSDLFGMRPVAECVSQVYERDLRPEVAKLVQDFWLKQDQSNSILIYAQEILNRTEAELTSQQKIDATADSVIKSTSCRDVEAAHWHVAVSIKEATDRYTWETIEILYQNP